MTAILDVPVKWLKPLLSVSATIFLLVGLFLPSDLRRARSAGMRGKADPAAPSGNGMTWTNRTSGTNANLYGVSCPSAGLCVAVGSAGTILTSPDGGMTWRNQASHTNSNLQSVSCASTKICVAVGHEGYSSVILTSGDGGSNWTARTNPYGAALYGVSCRDVLACVAVGFDHAIVASADGGIKWTSQTWGIGENLSGRYFSGVDCLSLSVCVVAGDGYPTSNIMISEDGGVNWSWRASGTGDALGSRSSNYRKKIRPRGGHRAGA